MKKINMLAICLIFLLGCSSNPSCKNNFYHPSSTNTIQRSSDFNQEHYVWENFIFTTNKVDQVK